MIENEEFPSHRITLMSSAVLAMSRKMGNDSLLNMRNIQDYSKFL